MRDDLDCWMMEVGIHITDLSRADYHSQLDSELCKLMLHLIMICYKLIFLRIIFILYFLNIKEKHSVC